MKNEDVENMLNRLQTPEPEKIMQHHELKIPLLSYKKSSRAGLWLLLLPGIFVITVFLRMVLGVEAGYLNFVRRFFSAIDNNAVLTYLVPLIFIGLPLIAMILNLLAFCHFQQNKNSRELIITVKYRPLNIFIFFLSFALLVYCFLPDALNF